MPYPIALGASGPLPMDLHPHRISDGQFPSPSAARVFGHALNHGLSLGRAFSDAVAQTPDQKPGPRKHHTSRRQYPGASKCARFQHRFRVVIFGEELL